MSSGRRGPGLRTTVAYFEHLLEFGLATSTVAGRGGGHRRPDARRRRATSPSRRSSSALRPSGCTCSTPTRESDCDDEAVQRSSPVHRGHARRVPRRQRAATSRASPAAWCGRTRPGRARSPSSSAAARGTTRRSAGRSGAGFADGAVVGNIFTSPSAEDAASVARAAHGDAGVLLTTGNYAGDVMNFGLAVTQLRSEGIDAQYFAVTDDIASAPAGEEAKTARYRRRFHRLQVRVGRRRGRPRPRRRRPGRGGVQRRHADARRRVRRLHPARRRPSAVHRARRADGCRPRHPRRAGGARRADAVGRRPGGHPRRRRARRPARRPTRSGSR